MPTTPTLLDDLTRCHLIAEIEPAHRSVVAEHVTTRRYEASAEIVREGDVGRDMFLVLAGEARVSQHGLEVGVLRAGDHFGELGLVAEMPRAATVTAMTALDVAVLTAAEYERLADADPRAALAFVRVAMRGARERLASITENVRVLLAERSLPRRMNVTVRVGSHVHEVPTGTLVSDLLPKRVDDLLVVGALVNRRAKSLVHRLASDCTLAPLTTAHWEGQRIYHQSLGLLVVEAARRIDETLEVSLDYAVGLGQKIRVRPAPPDLDALAARLESEMYALVQEDVAVREEWWTVDEAKAHFEQVGWHGAAELLASWYEPAVRLMSYGEVYALRLGPVLPATSMMRDFSVLAQDGALLLVFGEESQKRGPQSIWPGARVVRDEVRSAAHQTDLMTKHHARWLSALGIESVGEFNHACVTGHVSQLIHVSEGFQEKNLSTIADEIFSRGDTVKVICVAGPSSSGKTTFIKRLTVQLQVLGMNPVAIGLDDYYIDRVATPLDDAGAYDFEAFEALRADLLSEHLEALLRGERVKTAHFDFKNGTSDPHGGPELQLGHDDVLMLEGIHGLNPALLGSITDDRVFRIFICPLAQLPLDRVTRVHASDLRLIRRIVRDRHRRGHDAASNILMWPSVRRGERRNIFAYQHHADAVFDSSLIYELSVLRVFAERYLLEVPTDHEAFTTAHRLLAFLARFITIYPDHVPPTSILREFIGGSGFEY